MLLTYNSIDVGGHEVFYREGGAPSSPTILLLHGFPSSSAQFEPLMRHLATRHHVVAPDYPGFARSPALAKPSTFGRLSEVVHHFTEAIGLARYSLYMFDFGAPVGFSLAIRHPHRVESLILQNANAYEAGFGPAAQRLTAFWQDREGGAPAARGLLTLEAVREQYVAGVPEPSVVNPEFWELDFHYLERDGFEVVMLDLLFDIEHVVAGYPTWQAYLRKHTPPTLIAWGKNDMFFTAAGAQAYLADLPDARLELLDTGHTATATHSAELAELIGAFLKTSVQGPDGR
jgi:pimeloyl-ACP methyl ester carboxylesterase